MTTATMPDTDKAAQVHTILQRSVCLTLTCGHLGNHRRLSLHDMKMEKDGANIEAEKQEVGARIKLFASKDLRPCEHAISSVKHGLRALSVDGGTRLFGPSTYMIPLMAVSRAEEVLEKGRALVAEKVDDLVRLLPALIEGRRAKLGPLFREADYPTAEEAREAYGISWNYIRFGAPERLEEVSAAAYARSRADWDGRLSAAYDDVVTGLRRAALQVMTDLADRLGPGTDGQPKVLRPSALRDLQELLGNLPVLNSIGEDGALADVLARVGAVATGLEVQTLRDAPAVRGMLLEAASKAAAHLDALVTSGRRAMALE